jgi:hypothetical protein
MGWLLEGSYRLPALRAALTLQVDAANVARRSTTDVLIVPTQPEPSYELAET